MIWDLHLALVIGCSVACSEGFDSHETTSQTAILVWLSGDCNKGLVTL